MEQTLEFILNREIENTIIEIIKDNHNKNHVKEMLWSSNGDMVHIVYRLTDMTYELLLEENIQQEEYFSIDWACKMTIDSLEKDI